MPTRYPNTRMVVSPHLGALDDEHLAQVLARENIDIEAAEDWLTDVGNFVGQIAPTVLPIVGGAIGTAFGAPGVGAMLGTAAGGLVHQALAPQPGSAPAPAMPTATAT